MNKILKTLALVALAASLIGCTAARVTETPAGSGNYTTNYVTDPKLEAALTTAGAINAATAPVNPFSGLVEIGLGAIALGASWFAKRKNDQAAAQGQLLKVVVQGVNNSDNAEVKSAIESHAVNLGLESDLSKFVKQVESGLK